MTHKMGDHSHTIDDSTQILQNTDQSWKCYKNNNINIIKYNYVYCLYIYIVHEYVFWDWQYYLRSDYW